MLIERAFCSQKLQLQRRSGSSHYVGSVAADQVIIEKLGAGQFLVIKKHKFGRNINMLKHLMIISNFERKVYFHNVWYLLQGIPKAKYKSVGNLCLNYSVINYSLHHICFCLNLTGNTGVFILNTIHSTQPNSVL